MRLNKKSNFKQIGGNMKQCLLDSWLFKIHILVFLFPIIIVNAQERALYKLTESSDLIIVGNVSEINSKWENGNIWTYVTVRSSQTLKGDNKFSEITIRSLGGRVGEISQIISGGPKFEVGEVLLGFLEKDKTAERVYYCIGGKFGKYKFQEGEWVQNNSKQPATFIEKIKGLLKSK
jgi:hypothetical protein